MSKSVLGGKLIPVGPQVFVSHGQVGGPHAGRVLWREERGQSEQGHAMLPVKPDTGLAKVPGSSQGEPGQLQQSDTEF